MKNRDEKERAQDPSTNKIIGVRCEFDLNTSKNLMVG